METSNGLIPALESGEHWMTVREFARIYGFSERHIRRMADNTTLAEFGIPIYTVPRGSKKKIFILTSMRG